MSDLVYIQNDDTDFVSLSAAPTNLKLSRTVKGKLFKKHILSTGPLYYPGVAGGKVDIDKKFLDIVVRNFEQKVCPIVQVPIVDENNSHSEDPLRNIGEVVGLSVEGNKLYSIIDVRDVDAATKVGMTLIGASALLSLNRTDNRTGKKAGPTLIHTAITNNPHVNELDEFEELLAASSDDSSNDAVILTAHREIEEQVMDLDTLIATLRDEHNIDVPALQRAASEKETFAKLSASLQDKLVETELLKLSNTEDKASSEDILVAVTNIIDTNLELSNKVDALVEKNATDAATARVDQLVADGFILPVERDARLELLLSNAELFDKMLPEKALVALSSESGDEIIDLSPDKTIEGEIDRLVEYGASLGLSMKN